MLYVYRTILYILYTEHAQQMICCALFILCVHYMLLVWSLCVFLQLCMCLSAEYVQDVQNGCTQSMQNVWSPWYMCAEKVYVHSTAVQYVCSSFRMCSEQACVYFTCCTCPVHMVNVQYTVGCLYAHLLYVCNTCCMCAVQAGGAKLVL